jgi:hypothetical protein
MCYLLVYLVFDFPSEAILKDSTLVGQGLTRLASQAGFQSTDEGIESPVSAWNIALRRGQRSVWAAMQNPAGYTLTVSLVTNNWRRMYLSAERAPSAKPANLRALVEAGEIFYNALQPDYGFGLVALDTQALNPPGEGDYLPTTLHDFNFFSPRLVSKLGADKLAAVAASRTQAFADGGCLLELAPNPLEDRKPYTAAYQAAAAHLGLSGYQQGC